MAKLASLLNKKIVRISIAVIALSVFSAGIFYTGFKAGLAQPREVVLKNITGTEAPENVGANFNIFWQVWDIVKNDYLNGSEAVDQNLVYGAAEGLVRSLNDPNSNFFPPSDAKKFSEDVSGNFGGVGMEIGIRDKQLAVIAPLKNTPAERAGIKAADKILKINGTSTVDMDVNEAVKLIRGEVGTTVVLTILREGWKESREFSVKRDIIQVPTLDYEMKDGNIAYIQLYSFNENVPKLFYDASVKALFGEAKGMVLDLRGNPGGFLEVAVHLAGWFLDRGAVVVTEEFASGKQEIFRANGNQLLKDLPIVILVDEGSASASEILAGALRDHRKIKLVGVKTYGKGTVQELKDLSDGSVLKITVAHWLLPRGDLIDKNGIQPDTEVKMTDKDREAKLDPQFNKALEIIKEEIAKNKPLSR